MTRCVSNAYWASTLEKAKRRLNTLYDAGLGELNVSTGDYHQSFVKEDNIINAAEAAISIGISSMVIVVELQKERRVTASTVSSNPRLVNLLADEEFAKKLKIIESPWMPNSHDEIIGQSPGLLLNRSTVMQRRGCDSILTTLVATPQPNKIGICCGLSLERFPEVNIDWKEGQSLQDLYDQCAQDFIKIWLYVDGPERILAWAGSIDSSINWEKRYAHHCHACLAVFNDSKTLTVIREHYHERVDDVLLRYAVMSRHSRDNLKRSRAIGRGPGVCVALPAVGPVPVRASPAKLSYTGEGRPRS
jgi:hypothetical protein